MIALVYPRFKIYKKLAQIHILCPLKSLGPSHLCLRIPQVYSHSPQAPLSCTRTSLSVHHLPWALSQFWHVPKLDIVPFPHLYQIPLWLSTHNKSQQNITKPSPIVIINSSIIHNKQKVGTMKLSTMNGWTVTCPYNGRILINIKEWNSDVCYNMVGPWKHFSKWGKPVTKNTYWMVYMKYPE